MPLSEASDDITIHIQPPQAVLAGSVAPNQSEETDGPPSTGLIPVVIWTGGFVSLLLVAGVRWLRCIWRLTRAPTIDAPELQDMLARLSRQLKVRCQVRLQITSSRVGPAVMGVVRPLIVLPEAVVRDKAPPDLEAMLAHELIHVRRGDLWLGLLQVVAKAVWWFHPLVHWVSRQSTSEAERCCDEEVIGELACDPRRYACTLLEILELKRTLQHVPAFPGMKPVEVTSQRLERIMTLGQGCHPRTPRGCWVLVLVLSAFFLPGAAFMIADDESRTEPDQLKNLVLRGYGAYSLAGSEQQRATPPAIQVPSTLTPPFRGTLLLGGIEQLEPTDSSNGAALHNGSLVVATYSVGELLDELQRELACGPQEAQQAFSNMLVRAARLAEHPLSVKDRTKFFKRAFIAAASPDEHQRISAAVARMQKYGVSQITIEVRFVSVPEKLAKKTITDWQLTSLDLSGESSGDPRHVPIDRPLPTDITRPLAKAGVTTTTNLPAIYKVVDAQLAKGLIHRWQKDQRMTVLSVPRATLFNGQSATLSDSWFRPFVAGVSRSDAGEGAPEQQIRVVEGGRIVRIRPLLRQEDKLWLDYDVKVTEVQEVSLTTVQAAGLDEPITLQVPKVVTARIESAVELELGQTVIIGGLTEKAVRGQNRQLLVMMTARRTKQLDNTRSEVEEVEHERQLGTVISNLGVRGEIVAVGDAAGRMRVPILGPITTGDNASIAALSDNEVLRALDKIPGGNLPWVHERKRFDVSIVKEEIAEFVDPPRFVPMLGDAQLHHTHYKCTVYCRERADVAWPVPHTTEEGIKQVVYIDHCHFHVPTAPANEATSDVRAPGQQSQEVFTVVYRVGDLITPRPGVPKVEGRNPSFADVDRLVDLITTAIAPESWKHGPGRIEPVRTSASLVVWQTQDVHRQIRDLLKQARRATDVQINLAVRLARAPENLLKRLGITFEAADNGQTTLRCATLSKQQGHTLLHPTRSSERIIHFGGPSVTLFNAQQASIPFPTAGRKAEETLQVHATCWPDRRSVRLRVGIGADAGLIMAKEHSVTAGETIMLRVTDTMTGEKPPEPGRDRDVLFLKELFSSLRLPKADESHASGELLLLITPRIFIQKTDRETVILQ